MRHESAKCIGLIDSWSESCRSCETDYYYFVVVVTCTGRTLHISSTPVVCSRMIPSNPAPPEHWCSHSRRCRAEFLSARPGSLASPPRSAPSLLLLLLLLLSLRPEPAAVSRYVPSIRTKWSLCPTLRGRLLFIVHRTQFGSGLGWTVPLRQRGTAHST